MSAAPGRGLPTATLLLQALLLLAATEAHADIAHARHLFATGQADFATANYRSAIKAFEAVWAETHDPVVLRPLAQSYRRQYDVDHDVANLRAAQAAWRSLIDASAGVERDDASEAFIEVSDRIDEAEAAAQREAQQKKVDEEAGRRADEELPKSLVIAPGMAPVRTLRKPGIALLGAGGGLAALGLVFTLVAHGASASAMSTGAPGKPEPYASVAASVDSIGTWSALSFACYGIGLAAVAVGAVLVALPARRGGPRVTLAPTVGGASIAGSF
jgi:hypothetical protein